MSKPWNLLVYFWLLIPLYQKGQGGFGCLWRTLRAGYPLPDCAMQAGLLVLTSLRSFRAIRFYPLRTQATAILPSPKHTVIAENSYPKK